MNDLNKREQYTPKLCITGEYDTIDLDAAVAPLCDFDSATVDILSARRCQLSLARFSKVEISEGYLTDADVQSCTVLDSKLRNLCAVDADFTGSRFENVELHGLEALGADLGLTLFNHCNLARANLNHTTLTGSKIWGTDLTDATFVGAKLSKTEIDLGSYCTRADFRNADMTSVRIRTEQLRDAKFAGANLLNCLFTMRIPHVKDIYAKVAEEFVAHKYDVMQALAKIAGGSYLRLASALGTRTAAELLIGHNAMGWSVPDISDIHTEAGRAQIQETVEHRAGKDS